MLFPQSAPTRRVCQALRTLRPLLASLLVGCAAGFSALSAGDASGLDGSSGDSTDLLPAQGTTFGSTDPGTKVLQRLDAVEYDNTVRDLTGTQLTLAADNFPADDLYDNLDNIAANLVVSPALIGAFTDAALQLGNEVSAILLHPSTQANHYPAIIPHRLPIPLRRPSRPQRQALPLLHPALLLAPK